MSLSQASSDDFLRLIGGEFRCVEGAGLDGKHLLGYVKQLAYDGLSKEGQEESASDMSDIDDDPEAKTYKWSTPATVDYEGSDDDRNPPSDSDEDSWNSSNTSIKRKDRRVV
ncbi:hypothetical protein V7S43_018981 [Phytophthora oleae]|uniref:Uncharacterized protein n=1 Tax=Phytophthora oleae TaxID=2107226 RepID=A0ABD3ET51_9STRA